MQGPHQWQSATGLAASSRASLALAVLALGCSPFANVTPKEAGAYRAAYSFISQSPDLRRYCDSIVHAGPADCSLAVADQTTPISSVVFSGAIARANGVLDMRPVIDSMTRVDSIRFAAYRGQSLSRVFASLTSRSAAVGVYFSAPFERSVIADVVGPYEPGRPHSLAARHRHSLLFLLLLGSDSSVLKSYVFPVQHE